MGQASTRLLLVAQAGTPPPDLTQLAVRGAQIADRPDAVDLTPSARGMDIEFRDVTFGYREDQDILQVNAHHHQMLFMSRNRTCAGRLQVMLSVILLQYAATHKHCQR